MDDYYDYEPKSDTPSYDEKTIGRVMRFADTINRKLREQDADSAGEAYHDPSAMEELLDEFILAQRMDISLSSNNPQYQDELTRRMSHVEAYKQYVLKQSTQGQVMSTTDGGRIWKRENPSSTTSIDKFARQAADYVAEYLITRYASSRELYVDLDVTLEESIRRLYDEQKLSDVSYLGMLYMFELHETSNNELTQDTLNTLQACKKAVSLELRNKMTNLGRKGRNIVKTGNATFLLRLIGDPQNASQPQTFSQIVAEEKHRSRNDDEVAVRQALEARAAAVITNLYTLDR